MGITYYDTGTATLSVGSKTMTGQGTLWAGWVKPGDQVMPEEGTNNVVDVVVSNTEITLLKPYRGVAQAARPYTIMRTPDVVFTESLARQVLQKINDSTLVALAGLTPAARVGFRFDANKIAETFPLSDKGVSLVGQSDEAAMRSFLALVKQASLVDATADRLLTTGSFGVGATVSLASPNLNEIRPSGLYYCGSPTNGPGGDGWLRVFDLNAQYAYHEFTKASDATTYYRLTYAGSVGPWRLKIGSALGVAKAWALCSPAGAIFSSYNIASVTKNSTGQFATTYSTPLANANFVAIGSVVAVNGTIFQCTSGSFTPNGFSFATINYANAYVDPSFIMFAVFGATP